MPFATTAEGVDRRRESDVLGSCGLIIGQQRQLAGPAVPGSATTPWLTSAAPRSDPGGRLHAAQLSAFQQLLKLSTDFERVYLSGFCRQACDALRHAPAARADGHCQQALRGGGLPQGVQAWGLEANAPLTAMRYVVVQQEMPC